MPSDEERLRFLEQLKLTTASHAVNAEMTNATTAIARLIDSSMSATDHQHFVVGWTGRRGRIRLG
jgi:hypothetical protein